MRYDTLIHSGQYFDGTGVPPAPRDVAILDGKVVEIGAKLERKAARRCIDASGHWVMPGMIDNHTHTMPSCLSPPAWANRSATESRRFAWVLAL